MKKSKPKKNKTRKSIVLVIVLIIIILLVYISSIINTKFNITDTKYIYIDRTKNYEKLLSDIKLQGQIKDVSTFKRIAKILNYRPSNMKLGRYAIYPKMNILKLIQNLRCGAQAPINLTFNNIRTKEELAQRISEQLMLDKDSLFNCLNDSVTCLKLGFNKYNIIAMFIPNTYQVYWDISCHNLLNKMDREYKRFWNTKRLAQCQEIGLKPNEVSTLASIVEEECTYQDEYAVVAGLYINRLDKGQLLQADPTVKFAMQNFNIKRILKKYLSIKSLYNTYINKGLPPGPIRIPSIIGIESVLNYTHHNYLYMCAKDDFSGRHNFATTEAEHLKNAQKYREALNKHKIFR